MKKHKEGELYGIVTVYGNTFEIYYGYYEDFERESRWCEPVPVYPDLRAEPKYTDRGERIVTEMQAACEAYDGTPSADRCGLCSHFERGAELFGICKHTHKKGEQPTE